jgi:hypothetical protein
MRNWRIILAALPLLLGAAVVVLWVRSYSRIDGVALHHGPFALSLASCPGHLTLVQATFSETKPYEQQGLIKFESSEVAELEWPWDWFRSFARSRYGVGGIEVGLGGSVDPAGVRMSLRYFMLPHWLMLLTVGVVGTYAATPTVRSWRRNARGLCPACGYDLRASHDRCPECGAPIRLRA